MNLIKKWQNNSLIRLMKLTFLIFIFFVTLQKCLATHPVLKFDGGVKESFQDVQKLLMSLCLKAPL